MADGPNTVIVRRYRPAFFEGFKVEAVTVTSMEQLVEIPWIAQHAKADGFERYDVHVSEACGVTQVTISAICAEVHWVIAMLEGPGAKALSGSWSYEPVESEG
ncbi:MAG: hypothetical protein O7G84_01035 [Gammaproteobacteria bacterium]|nr:hypothetical protein [Gammaproteobacteria bacterium]